RTGAGQGESSPTEAVVGAAVPSAAEAAPDGRKRTSQSPPSSSLSSWVNPFEPSTCRSGVGLNVASSRRPWPGSSASTVSMICPNGSPPARRIGRTSRSTKGELIAGSSLGCSRLRKREKQPRPARARGKAKGGVHVQETARANQLQDDPARRHEHGGRGAAEDKRGIRDERRGAEPDREEVQQE